MSNRYVRIATGAFLSFGLALAAGCATRPDIVGHNDEAEEWAEQQRHDPKDKTQSWPGSRAKVAAPQQPAAAQPAAAPSPAAPQGAAK